MSAICGIYKYENKINGKVYIGQSTDIKARIRGHRHASYPGDKDFKMPIHQAIYKYGEENFDISILEECPKEQLNEREIYWISYFNSYEKGYNATIGGNESHIHLGKPVELYDLEGNYVKEYSNITEAAKALEISRNTIYGILSGNRLSAKGYQFKLKDDNKIINKYHSRQGGKIPIIQLSMNNEFIKEWESAAEASRTLAIDSSAITKVLKRKLKSTGGFKWKYKEELI